MPFFVLHPREIERVQKEKNAIVVDLRERSQYQQYHYRNAVLVPYEEKERWFCHFNKNNTYILYCEHGNVSLMAARKLSQRGIFAYTVVGGAEGIRRYDKYFKD